MFWDIFLSLSCSRDLNRADPGESTVIYRETFLSPPPEKYSFVSLNCHLYLISIAIFLKLRSIDRHLEINPKSVEIHGKAYVYF